MAESSSAPSADSAPPMTATLMGRLFVVPAIVVCVLVGVAVVVVLFGTSSIDKPRSIDNLLTLIESDSGDRSMRDTMLLPKAKESWQAAEELARRLATTTPSVEEIDTAVERIIRILEKRRGTSSPDADDVSERRGLALDQFLISALARLKTPASLEAVAEMLSHEQADIRRVALLALADMRDVPAAGDALARVYPLLKDESSVVQMTACLTVAALASPDDAFALRQLGELLLSSDRELQWNAAQALARLGSPRGKLVMMNMLDRKFWQDLQLDYQEGRNRIQRQLAEAEIVERLCAAISAAAYLQDDDVKSLVEGLQQNDAAYAVREAARQAIEKMESSQTDVSPDARSAAYLPVRIGEYA